MHLCSAFKPFVDHISIIMLFLFRWSRESSTHCFVHSWSDCTVDRDCVFFVIHLICGGRYPAAFNNATGFFYTIIICSVINTLTRNMWRWDKEGKRERVEEKSNFQNIRFVHDEFDSSSGLSSHSWRFSTLWFCLW